MPIWSINHFIRPPLLVLGLVELAILYSSVFTGAMLVYSDDAGSFIQDADNAWLRASIVAVVTLACLVSMGLYNFHQRIYFREVFVRVGVGFVISALVLAALYYFIPSVSIPVRVAGTGVIYAITLVLLVRYIFLQSVDQNFFRRRTLIYGAGERAASISDLRRKADRRGFKIVGSVPAPGDTNIKAKNGLLIDGKSLAWLAEELEADEIVIAMDDRRGNLPIRELLDSKLRGVDVIDLLEFLERETGKIRVDLVNPGWLIFAPGFRSTRFRRLSKGLLDAIVSLVGLLIAWPLMLIISAAIKIEDGWRAPVFYRQKRVGAKGVVFNVLKFRSMHVDAEQDGEAVWAEANDSRITKVGCKIRKYRLDEIPQILNVLRGQMSLVGPRPERPEFVEELAESIPYYSERHTVKPGLTGWAQLRYSYGASEEDAIEKLQYDLYYIKNQSLILDAMIMLQTVEVILWGKGAR